MQKQNETSASKKTYLKAKKVGSSKRDSSVMSSLIWCVEILSKDLECLISIETVREVKSKTITEGEHVSIHYKGSILILI